MKSYPYIGELNNGTGGLILFCDKDFGAQLNNYGRGWSIGGIAVYTDEWDECKFKNITREYLANTYGKVESKQHAEFIKKLAEANGIACSHNAITKSLGFFYFFGGSLFFTTLKVGDDGKFREITIPLPPNQLAPTATPEEEFEMKQIEKNNGDNLIFGGDDKCEEWPCIGDEVLTSDGKGLVKLLPDSKGYYVVSINGEYYQYQIYELEKPKTPEEELRDEITKVIHDDVYKGMYDKESLSIFADALMSKFEITKKPQ